MTRRILTPAEAHRLQVALNLHGAHLVVDDHYGELSHLALIAFQHASNLPETGNPDIATTDALGIEAITDPAPAAPRSNPLDNPLVRIGISVLLSNLTKGKFPMLTTMDKAWVAGVVAFVCNYIVNHFFHITIDDGTQGLIVNVIATFLLPMLAVWIVPNKPKTA